MNKDKTAAGVAKVIRIVTVPPVLTAVLLILLAVTGKGVYSSAAEVEVSMLFLVILPLLAYPVSAFTPVRILGRSGQRDLAMWLSCIGYFLAVIYGFTGGRSRDLRFIFLVYLVSVLLLLLSNKIIGLKASGHACSLTGPVVIAGYYFRLPAILTGCAICFLVFWASVKTGRHTVRELVLGGCLCLLAWLLSWICIFG